MVPKNTSASQKRQMATGNHKLPTAISSLHHEKILCANLVDAPNTSPTWGDLGYPTLDP